MFVYAALQQHVHQWLIIQLIDSKLSQQNVGFIHGGEACQAVYDFDCKGTVILSLSNSGL